MHVQITRLLDAIGRAGHSAPPDVPGFLRSLPEPGYLPSPWETWTLIGLVRHRERQSWVRSMIITRLQGDIGTLAASGAFGHPEGVAQRGSLPGMTEWEYYFHGIGCCLTHKVTGEEIDVDFFDDSSEFFSIYFYTTFLKSLRKPEAPERRLLELHRSVGPIGIAVTHLLTAGAMVSLSDHNSGPARIAEEVFANKHSFDAFCQVWEDPARRVWLAAIIGDWLAAHDAAAGQPEIEQVTGSRAEKCRAIRRQQLLQVTGYPASDALFGLTELGGADQELEQAFRGPPSGVISAALEIVEQQDDSKWCPHIYEMFRRINPDGQPLEPHLWIRSLKFLCRHGYKKQEMISSLPKTQGTEIDEGLLLALENAPEHALPLIRRGLLSNAPCNRTAVAAILALIAQPWSMRELLGALQASNDQEKTAAARAALLETGDLEAEKAVLAWEHRNPHEDERGHYVEVNGRQVGPCYSMAEHMLMSTASYVRCEMDKLHDRVMKIKNVIPPEPKP